MSMLDDFKTDLGIFDNTKDALLGRLIKKATADIIAFTHQPECYVLSQLSEIILDLATIRYNQKNAEGLTSQSYSGSSDSYLNDIPTNIQRTLITYRKVGWK